MTDTDLFTAIRAAAPAPATPFLRSADGAPTLTYAALSDRAAQFASVLAASGVRPGDRVAAYVEKSEAVIALYLGCLMAGAVYLPLNAGYTLAEVGYFLKDAEPALLICDPAKAAEVSTLGVRVETLGADGQGTMARKADAASAAFTAVPREPDDLAAILYTSGTTGRSKGAMLTHANLRSNAETLVEAWRFTGEDVLIHALPIFHTHGLFVAINTALLAGASMIFQPKFDAAAVLAALPNASVLMGVPTFYTRLLAEPGLTAERAAPMRLFVSGSAPLLAETHDEWRARTGHAILERYGMTETNMITSNPYDGARKPGTVGPPLAGVSARVAPAEGGAPLPQGEIGVIEVKGPNVFQGYWRMPEKTAAEFRADGWFITGDLGTIDADGYVSIVGRGKDLIISGGYNVYPKEVEAEIDAMPGVAESAVIGLPHPDFGEGVAAVVVARPGAAPDEAAILAALADRLAAYKRPKRLLFADALPRNAMGKVQKAELRARHADLFSPKGSA